MKFKSRRLADRVMTAGWGLIVGLAALFGAGVSDSERITAHWASATVEESGVAQVTEVIDYDFGSSDRRGIFRDVPGLDPAAPVTASSATAPDDLLVQPEGTLTRIRIGNPDITIDGRHRYTITYPATVVFDNGRISWNGVGSKWPVGIDNIELHLLAATELVDPECSVGSFGADGGCEAELVEPGHLLVTVDSVASLEGVTVSATPGAMLAATPTAAPPQSVAIDDPGTGLLLPAGLAAVLGLASASATAPFIRRAGREQVWAGGAADAAFGSQLGETDYAIRRADYAELAEMASIEFAPPRGVTAWQGGIVHHEGVDNDHKVAWLLERAIAGEVGIAGEGKDLLIHRAPVDSPEAEMLDKLFDGRQTVELGSYDKDFAQGWTELESRLKNWHNQSPYWDPNGNRRRTQALGFGFLLGFVGLLTTSIGAGFAGRFGPMALIAVVIGAVLAGGGLGLVIRSWELRVRTPEGSGLWILTESFRRFIHQSDAQHVEAAAAQGRLLEYTAWAAGLGEVARWTNAIQQADIPRNSINPAHLYLASAAPHLGSATSKASTAPSSSGGGGGGAVGGGGGGGGGGSW